MKLEIEKEWCIRMAQLEGDAEIGAGRLAVDPVFDGDVIPGTAGDEEGSNVAFGRFVRLMRRQRGLTLERLADDADVDMVDLVEDREQSAPQAGASHGLSACQLFQGAAVRFPAGSRPDRTEGYEAVR